MKICMRYDPSSHTIRFTFIIRRRSIEWDRVNLSFRISAKKENVTFRQGIHISDHISMISIGVWVSQEKSITLLSISHAERIRWSSSGWSISKSHFSYERQKKRSYSFLMTYSRSWMHTMPARYSNVFMITKCVLPHSISLPSSHRERILLA